MAFVRYIGRWTMTLLVINTIIGGGIFGLPGELTRLLGRASPIAMIVGAAGMAVIIACFGEVASQFSEPGGPFLYARAAFGRFVSIQIGWMHLLSVVSGLAALTALFVDYLAILLPASPTRWERILLMAVVIAIPAAVNYRGIKSGARLNNITTVAKLLPLALLIVVGVGHFSRHPQVIHTSEIVAPGLSNWIRAMVFMVFALGGWEDTVIPTGEISEPRRTIPFGLFTALGACAVIYMFLQFITVATIGGHLTDTPLAETASVLLGTDGARFVTVAALISIYGWISSSTLNGPRLGYSLGAQGDFPSILARLHPRFNTPAISILLYGFICWGLAASGTFLWLAALSSGTMIVLYGVTCAALIRLRKLRPDAPAFRIPFGPALSVLAVAICLSLFTGLKLSEIFLMGITVLIATANWLIVIQRRKLAARHSHETTV
jgi:basic amino acid/polyamine antiporter, APA family